MKLSPNRRRMTTTLTAGVAVAVLIGAALAQPRPPTPGGGPGGPAPGPGPGAPGPGGGPGGGPGPGPGGQGPGAGGPTPTFVVRMCNKSNEFPVIFVATVGIVGQQFRAQGWTQVPRGQCVPVGAFTRPMMWWHAREPTGVVWGQKFDVDLCVNLNGGYDFTWDGSPRTCQQGETGVGFLKIEVPPNAPSFDMSLT
jgi:Protein of unknown function (DUF1036)